jgi:hypothetical protein
MDNDFIDDIQVLTFRLVDLLTASILAPTSDVMGEGTGRRTCRT